MGSLEGALSSFPFSVFLSRRIFTELSGFQELFKSWVLTWFWLLRFSQRFFFIFSRVFVNSSFKNQPGSQNYEASSNILTTFGFDSVVCVPVFIWLRGKFQSYISFQSFLQSFLFLVRDGRKLYCKYNLVCATDASAMADVKSTHADPDMQGWLSKWTNYIKGYQRRWFVLSNGLLSYYRWEIFHCPTLYVLG